MARPIKLVLDTNVVLDWLVFKDPDAHSLRDGVRAGCVRVVTHALAFDELRRVLSYPQLDLAAAMQSEILLEYQTQTSVGAMPDDFSREHLMLPIGFPRCRDGDDDHFLALAFHAQADALVTRDNTVLSLRARAERFGVKVINVQQMIEMLTERSIE
ncbi:MAG: putative toxin-antitoxin system toxin component, PIN family [Candidatus Obscuribacterales bacterium]|nr:putative toxin-antitoxin system toxin component, PIN family [Steroidobacteraceae bacterium]